jgi:flagellar biosynthesis/type III secretory pathway chaperone
MQDILSSPEKVALQQEICLYKELLQCLKVEWQALINSQEDAILALAAQKEHILAKIISAATSQDFSEVSEPDLEILKSLKHEAAQAQARNHRLITTALETIQDFLSVLQSPPPGIYHFTGKVNANSENSLFHRQA